MRRIDPELQARLDGGATRLCRCWVVRRRDGTELGFTDHDRDITIDAVVCRASSGMDATALQSATGLSVDNAQAAGALTSAALNEDDIRAGKYDGAEIRQWLVDWERPELQVLMFRGHLGEIRRSDGVFEVELRGLAEALNAPVGRSVLRSCDRALGDTRCGFDASQPGFAGEGVVESASADRITASGLAGFAAEWFTHGAVTWLSGANAGEKGAVKVDRPGEAGLRSLTLWQEPVRRPMAGDRFRVVAGCDKRAETCRAKFDNLINFRGFPHIPGDDWVTAYPKDGATHDGGSQQG
jgi:uncharacterized phage protein (TIGR02218 family)